MLVTYCLYPCQFKRCKIVTLTRWIAVAIESRGFILIGFNFQVKFDFEHLLNSNQRSRFLVPKYATIVENVIQTMEFILLDSKSAEQH